MASIIVKENELGWILPIFGENAREQIKTLNKIKEAEIKNIQEFEVLNQYF